MTEPGTSPVNLGRDASGSTRTVLRSRTAKMVAVAALVIAACGGGGTQESTGDPTEPSPAATGIESRLADPCSGPLPTDRFSLETAAAIPTVGDDGSVSTLGSDGAATILDQLIVSDRSVCALEVSPSVQEVINAVRAASAQGDRSEVRRLLEQLIRVDLAAEASPIGSVLGQRIRIDLRAAVSPLGSVLSIGPSQDLQKVRDNLAAAAEAYAQGEDELGDEAMDRAREGFTEYAEGAILATEDVVALLTIAAQAQLLGLDGIAEEAIDKARDLLEKELEAVTDRYEPCTSTPAETRELLVATARVQLIGGDSSEGDSLISASLDIYQRRANDEPVPECGSAWSLAMTLVVAGDSGDVITFLWDGVFTVSDGEIDGEGIGTVLGSGQCRVNGSALPVREVTGMFTFEVTGTQVLRDGTEWLTLRVDATEAGIEFSYEDPECALLWDMNRVFLGLVPTFPAQSYPRGFDIQVTDEIGFVELAIEPYILEVEVTQLGE